jgi:hypothetical protein
VFYNYVASGFSRTLRVHLKAGTANKTCSHPNQVHPVLLPDRLPPDRPASITLLVFVNGVFTGTNMLIRSDLYNGHTCKATEARIDSSGGSGYCECVHQSQAG